MTRRIPPHQIGGVTRGRIPGTRTNIYPVEELTDARLAGILGRTGRVIAIDEAGNPTVVAGSGQPRSRLITGSSEGLTHTRIITPPPTQTPGKSPVKEPVSGRGFSKMTVTEGPSEGEGLTIGRARSQRGERKVSVLSYKGKMRTANDPTAGFSDLSASNELCEPTSGGTGGMDSPSPPPSGPSGGLRPGNFQPRPPEPDEEDPPTTPEGCSPGPTQWYFNQCPAGYQSLGFADLPDGSNMVLCRNPSGPATPGDGCPETPDTYGWTCTSTGCVEVANGQYATQAECETACVEDEPINDSEDPPLPETEPIETGPTPNPGTYDATDLGGVRVRYTRPIGGGSDFTESNVLSYTLRDNPNTESSFDAIIDLLRCNGSSASSFTTYDSVSIVQIGVC